MCATPRHRRRPRRCRSPSMWPALPKTCSMQGVGVSDDAKATSRCRPTPRSMRIAEREGRHLIGDPMVHSAQDPDRFIVRLVSCSVHRRLDRPKLKFMAELACLGEVLKHMRASIFTQDRKAFDPTQGEEVAPFAENCRKAGTRQGDLLQAAAECAHPLPAASRVALAATSALSPRWSSLFAAGLLTRDGSPTMESIVLLLAVQVAV